MTPRPTSSSPALQNCRRQTAPPRGQRAPAVALVAAVASNGIIGAENRLPWRLADDLRRFRALTLGHAVIMGRKTWESLSRALPGRQNIVVTRQHGYAAAGAEVARSFDEALALVRLPDPVFCIGGAELYRIALPRACRLHLTEIDRDFDGDAKFPSWHRPDWREVAREAKPADGADEFGYAFVTYERAAPAA